MERVEHDEKVISWMYVVFTDTKENKVIRRIPYKAVRLTMDKSKDKITVFDTKKFKLKGPRIFKGTDKIDPWSFFSVIEIQGYDEGWYDPRFVNVHTEPSTKQQILEKYSEFNDWLKGDSK